MKSPTKILIADDCPISRCIHERVFTAETSELEVLNDGASAFASMTGTRDRLVALVDVDMPGMSGLEICKQLSLHPNRSLVYVILVSAAGDKAAIIAGLDAGADDYVAKPIESGELLARVRRGMRHLSRLAAAHPGGPQTQPHPGQPAAATSSGARVVSVAPAPGHERRADCTLSKRFSSQSLLLEISAALTKLKCAKVESLERHVFPDKTPNFGAWSALLLPKKSIWMDLVIETDRCSAATFFERSSGLCDASDSDLLSTMGDVLKIVVRQLISALTVDGCEAITPTPPQPVRVGGLSALHAYPGEHLRALFGIDKIPFCVTLFPHHAPVHRKNIGEIQIGTVSMESLTSLSSGELNYRNRGMMLQKNLLEQLRQCAAHGSCPLAIDVMGPTPLFGLAALQETFRTMG